MTVSLNSCIFNCSNRLYSYLLSSSDCSLFYLFVDDFELLNKNLFIFSDDIFWFTGFKADFIFVFHDSPVLDFCVVFRDCCVSAICWPFFIVLRIASSAFKDSSLLCWIIEQILSYLPHFLETAPRFWKQVLISLVLFAYSILNSFLIYIE